MTRTTAARKQGAPSSTARTGSQRERMLAGIVSATSRVGYAKANVASVIGEAGVSRPTFYEHFSDREECFLAAAEDVSRQLLERVRIAVQDGPAQSAAATAVKELVRFAGTAPERARFLMSDTLAGGPRTLDVRDHGVSAIAAVLERAYEQVEENSEIPDMPSEVLIGASWRLLASRLRRGQRALAALETGLLGWTHHYEQPAGTYRRRTCGDTPAPPGLAPVAGSTPLRAPPALAPGRPRISEEAVAENHRQRIMFATAALVQRRGYSATTIAQITKLAGVDGRVFYRLFTDKQDAFSAVHELGFQQLMAATAGAFFTGEDWPARMWQALGALTAWLERNPAIAHVGFVESYAVGPGAVQRVEDSLIAFTIFLQEGYQHPSRETAPTRLGLEAIVTSVFEVLYREIRRSSEPRLTAMLPELIHVSLTPFLGGAQSAHFIEQKLAGGERPASQPRSSRARSQQ